MSLDAALVYQPGLGWYLAPSPELEAVARQRQTPPRFLQEDTMTVAADLGTCTWASCREKATSSTKEGWNFCNEHRAADAALKDEQDHIVRRPAHQPLPRPAAQLTSVPTAPPASPIGKLLEDASQHSRASVRTLAGRIEKQLDQLRALIKEHEATEAARRAEAEAKERAKAEVARLEAQLAAAKAKLRKPPTVSSSSGVTDVSCGKCGRPYAYAKARDKHEATCQAGAA